MVQVGIIERTKLRFARWIEEIGCFKADCFQLISRDIATALAQVVGQIAEDVDQLEAFAEANTVYGKLGIKCWICKGETKIQKIAPQAEAVSA